MNSGLTAGDAYPIKATFPSATATATIEDTSTLSTATTSLRINGVVQTTQGSNAVALTYSTGRDADDTAGYAMASTYIGFFFSSSTDTRVRQEYYFEAATTLTFAGSATGFAATTAISGGGSSTTNQTGVTVTMTVKSTNTTSGDFVQFVFPYGTTFGSTAFTFASTSDTFNTPKTLSASTRFYQFPTAWSSLSAQSGGAFTTPVALSLSAINSRISDFSGVAAGKTRYHLFREAGTAVTAACEHSATLDWTAMGLANTTKPFTTCSISLPATNTQSAATKAFT
jgi:hypothetical protein